MTSNSPPNEPDAINLSEEEKARIRAEVRYAIIAANEARPPEKSKSVINNVFSFLSSGFVLLLVGSGISSLLVPMIQQGAEQRKERASHLQELFEQFNLYSNTIYEEYLAIYPLAVQERLSEEDYNNYTQKIFNLKLKRANAYAKIQTLVVIVDKNMEKIDDKQTSKTIGKEQYDKKSSPSSTNSENNLALAIECYRSNIELTSNNINNFIEDFYKQSKNIKEGETTIDDAGFPSRTVANIADNVNTRLTGDRETVQKLIGQQIHPYVWLNSLNPFK